MTAITDAMTFLATQEAGDNRLNTGHLLIWAATSSVTELVAIAALVNTAIKRNTSIFETSKVLPWRGGPLVEQRRALSLVRGEVAD